MASTRLLASGKWQAQVRRRGMRPSVRSFGTKVEAARWARHLESELDRGIFLDRSEAERTSLAAHVDRYLVEFRIWGLLTGLRSGLQNARPDELAIASRRGRLAERQAQGLARPVADVVSDVANESVSVRRIDGALCPDDFARLRDRMHRDETFSAAISRAISALFGKSTYKGGRPANGESASHVAHDN